MYYGKLGKRYQIFTILPLLSAFIAVIIFRSLFYAIPGAGVGMILFGVVGIVTGFIVAEGSITPTQFLSGKRARQYSRRAILYGILLLLFSYILLQL